MMTFTCRKISILLAVFLGVWFVCTPLFALEGFKITAVAKGERLTDRVMIYLTAENQLDTSMAIWGQRVGQCGNREVIFGTDAFYDSSGLYVCPVGESVLFSEEWIKHQPFYTYDNPAIDRPTTGTRTVWKAIVIPPNSTVVFACADVFPKYDGDGEKTGPVDIFEVYFSKITPIGKKYVSSPTGGTSYLLRVQVTTTDDVIKR